MTGAGRAAPDCPSTMPTQIPDFSDTEFSIVRQTITERFHKDVPIDHVEAELRIEPSDRTLTPCPGLYWSEQGAHFAIFKVGDSRFRCQFFYRVHQQYGTGKPEYTDIGDCVITLLQVQADHAIKNRAESA